MLLNFLLKGKHFFQSYRWSKAEVWDFWEVLKKSHVRTFICPFWFLLESVTSGCTINNSQSKPVSIAQIQNPVTNWNPLLISNWNSRQFWKPSLTWTPHCLGWFVCLNKGRVQIKGLNSLCKVAILGRPSLLAVETQSQSQKSLPRWNMQIQFRRSQCHWRQGYHFWYSKSKVSLSQILPCHEYIKFRYLIKFSFLCDGAFTLRPSLWQQSI